MPSIGETFPGRVCFMREGAGGKIGDDEERGGVVVVVVD
jgi:hypothetical protein